MVKIIRNIQTFTPENIGIKDIVVLGNSIAEISSESSMKFDKAEIIDGTGLYALPGLIDQHVHLTGGGGENGFNSRVPEILMSDIVQAGITTVVGLLGTDTTTRSVETLLAKTKELNINGITAYCLTGGYAYPSITLTGSVLKDIAFIDEILGLKIAIADHRSSYPSSSELTNVTSEVIKAGLLSGKKTYIHLHMGRDSQALKEIETILDNTSIPISVFRPTHCKKLTKDAIRFCNMGGFIDFTATEESASTALLICNLIGEITDIERVTISSDSNGSFPLWDKEGNLKSMNCGKISNLYKTFISLVQEHSMGISKALPFFTSNVARSIGKYPQKGCLETGSDADILLCNKDLSIHSLLAKGEYVIKNKQIVKKGLFE